MRPSVRPVLLVILLSGSAFAQEAETVEAETEAAAVLPERVWAIEAVESMRFPDADVVGPRFEEDAELEVLTAEGERYRVRLGDKYGWVAITAVSTEEPAAPAFDLGSFQLDANSFGGGSLGEGLPSGGAGAGE